MEFKVSDVQRILGIKRTRIKQWIQLDLFKPSLKEGEGRGRHNLYSLNDLYGLAIIDRLLKLGMSRNDVREVVRDKDWVRIKDAQFQYASLKTTVFKTEFGDEMKSSNIRFSKEPPSADIVASGDDLARVINLARIFARVDEQF
jgi:DNA-binding transcriptional MerR regulator